MKTKLLLSFTALAALVVVSSGCRSTCCSSKGAPAAAKVVFENDKVRIIEYQTGKEKNICGIGMHTHPAHAFIMKTDAKLRVVGPDGKESFENAKAGDAGWETAEEHICQNLSGNNAGCYVIEIKDKDWKPSTGLTK